MKVRLYFVGAHGLVGDLGVLGVVLVKWVVSKGSSCFCYCWCSGFLLSLLCPDLCAWSILSPALLLHFQYYGFSISFRAVFGTRDAHPELWSRNSTHSFGSATILRTSGPLVFIQNIKYANLLLLILITWLWTPKHMLLFRLSMDFRELWERLVILF